MNRKDAQKILKQQYLGIRGAALYALQLPLWLAIPVNLFRGKLLGVATAAVAIGLLSYAARLTQQHYRSRSANLARSGLDQADNDYRPYALAFTALAAATTAFSVRPGIAFALISALLAAAGYYLGYIHDSRPEDAYQAPPRAASSSSTCTNCAASPPPTSPTSATPTTAANKSASTTCWPTANTASPPNTCN